ncbi:MAG TPA: serine protease [Gemmatimonadales bacterium]|nr:serine protease [Gemmatimonadales bacterium]
MRAIRATDFAGMAQENQAAVGLITVALGGDRYDGTGFVISPDGYMLTNWHVVADSAHAAPDTVWVTMADQSVGRHADVIAASRDRDIALIKIRGYQGGHLTAIDWGGTKARQGGPAALIGYPAGCAGRGCAAAALQPGADANGDRTLGSGNPAHAEVLATSWSMLSSFAKS